MNAKVDNLYRCETPEGVDLTANIAGPVVRIVAYVIDLSIRALILMVFSMVVGFLGSGGIGLLLLVSFLLEWFWWLSG